MNDQYHKALSEKIRQTIRDSEEDYVNETFWRVYPAFLLVIIEASAEQLCEKVREDACGVQENN